jgi:molybdopterin-guanine dinucleotide biosynthesis protein A
MHPAYILCGGRSRRFGSDKARTSNAGQPQLLQLRDQLVKAGHEVHFVADRADRFNDLGVSCLVDPQADSGPLAGLSCALTHHARSVAMDDRALDRTAGWLLLVSCDQAHWDPTWYRVLLDHASSIRLPLTSASTPTSASTSMSISTSAATSSVDVVPTLGSAPSQPEDAASRVIRNEQPRAPLSAVAWFETVWQPLPGLYHIDILADVNQRLQDRRLSLHQLLDALEACGGSEKIVTARSPSAWSFNTPDELAHLPPT